MQDRLSWSCRGSFFLPSSFHPLLSSKPSPCILVCSTLTLSQDLSHLSPSLHPQPSVICRKAPASFLHLCLHGARDLFRTKMHVGNPSLKPCAGSHCFQGLSPSLFALLPTLAPACLPLLVPSYFVPLVPAFYTLVTLTHLSVSPKCPFPTTFSLYLSTSCANSTSSPGELLLLLQVSLDITSSPKSSLVTTCSSLGREGGG